MFGRRRAQPGERFQARRDDGDAPDDTPFAALYRRFAHRVHAYALQRLHDPKIAADITSTTFVRALAAYPRFIASAPDGSGTQAEGWLLTIARNVIVDHVRTNKRHIVLDVDSWRDRLPIDTHDPAHAPVAPDERDLLLEALRQLPETQQRIVLLRLQGWNGVEIADLLGMSHGAVRVAQYRAYSRLRERLTPDAQPESASVSVSNSPPDVVPETNHA